MDSSTLSDKDLVQRFLDVTADLSLREASAKAGIDHATIAKWRRGEWKRIYPSTRRELMKYLQEHTAGEGAADADVAFGVFGSFDEIARQLRGIAPPGQAQARKRDALEGLRRTAADFGWKLPDWWYRLREMVDEDQI